MLVDPWIVYARGFAEDAATIDQPALLETIGEGVLRFYDEAMKYDSTRVEATIRGAWVLVRLNRPADALARWSEPTGGSDARQIVSDPVLLYWMRLIRARAFDALGRSAEARAAYESALAVAPNAPSPVVAMMALDMRENRREEASRRAAAIRTQADPVVDTWWIYAHGDLRFFQARLRALRDMVAKWR
jgi:tetratricopeptide (TPR) repeat protein